MMATPKPVEIQKVKFQFDDTEYIFEVPKFEYVINSYIANGTHGPLACFFDMKNNKGKTLVTISKICKCYDNPQRGKEILRELVISMFIDHPNLIKVIDIVIPPKLEWMNIYIVSEYMPSNLERLINACKKKDYLEDKKLIPWIIYQVLVAVKYLHSSNIMHRNIKPSNILIDDKGDIKLCGFGNARCSKYYEQTLKGEINSFTSEVGCLCYRAPEILASKKKLVSEYDERVDIWSIGVVMAELYKREITFFKMLKKDNKSSWEAMLGGIFKILGKPSRKEIDKIASKERAKTIYKFHDYPKKDLKKEFPKDTDPLAIDLIKKFLKINKDDRISIDDALKHPYFDIISEYRDDEDLERPKKDIETYYSDIVEKIKEENKIKDPNIKNIEHIIQAMEDNHASFEEKVAFYKKTIPEIYNHFFKKE